MEKRGFMFTLLIFVFFFLVLISVVNFMRNQQAEEALAVIKIRADSLKSFSEEISADSNSVAYTSAYNSLKTMSTYVATNNNKNFMNDSKCLMKSCIYELMSNASIGGAASYQNLKSQTIYFNSAPYMGNTTLAQWISQLNSSASQLNLVMNLTISDISVYQADPWNVRVSYVIYLSIKDNSKESIATLELLPVNVAVPISGLEEPSYSMNTSGAFRRYIQKYPDSNYTLAIKLGTAFNGSATNWTYARVIKSTPTPACAEISSLPTNYILVVQNSTLIANRTYFCPAINSFKGFIFQNDSCIFNNSCVNSALPYAYNFTMPIYNSIVNNTFVLLSGDTKEVWNISKLVDAYQNGYFFEANFAPSYLMRLSGNFSQSVYGIEAFVKTPAFLPTRPVASSNVDYLYLNKTALAYAYACRVRGAKNCENYTVCLDSSIPHFMIDLYRANKTVSRYVTNHTEFYGFVTRGTVDTTGSECSGPLKGS